MTIYIAGQMTGIKDFNRPAFFEAERRLVNAGFKVLNPAKIGELPEYEMYWPINKAMIDGADAIYLLEGWENSPGANKEVEYAESKNIEVKSPSWMIYIENLTEHLRN